MNSRFFKRCVKLVATGAVAAVAIAPTFALAGGKGKSDRSSFSQSNGNGGGNSGGGNSSMKFHASRSKSLSGISSNGGGSGGAGGSSFSQSFSAKKSKSFGQMNQSQSFQNLYSTSNGNGNGGSNLSGIKKSGRNSRHAFPIIDQQNLANAVQTGKFKPIDSGIGNGTGGTIKWPGKFAKVDNGQIGDSLKKHKPFPVEGIRIGEPNGPGNWPGNGNGGGHGNGDGKGPGKGGKNKDCHDNFPWWPIIVGGCYGGGYGGNCHNHNGCYDNYNGGCYNNGGYYNNTVSYPSVTNIVIEQPAVAPAVAPEATLATGIDLELLDVRLVDPGDAARNLGPRYRMTFGNRGTLPAGNFQVLLMASADGKPQAGAPSATSEISGLASRQVFAADVRLPLTADLATLAKYIVVVDSAAQIGEPDENNNLAVLDREKIATVDATAVAVQ
jgi:hypothetical protein